MTWISDFNERVRMVRFRFTILAHIVVVAHSALEADSHLFTEMF